MEVQKIAEGVTKIEWTGQLSISKKPQQICTDSSKCTNYSSWPTRRLFLKSKLGKSIWQKWGILSHKFKVLHFCPHHSYTFLAKQGSGFILSIWSGTHWQVPATSRMSWIHNQVSKNTQYFPRYETYSATTSCHTYPRLAESLGDVLLPI